MPYKKPNIKFKKQNSTDNPPYTLLLLADPSKEMIDKYIYSAEIYAAELNGKARGFIVLFSLTPETVEIKNIAVEPAFQGQGIGRFLIENAIAVAAADKKKSICIGTANSSISQLAFYQKMGFEISDIKKDFFIENYTELIYENDIQAKHLLMLTKSLFQFENIDIDNRSTVHRISISVSEEDVDMPQGNLKSNFTSIDSWLLNLCKRNTKAKAVETYYFELVESVHQNALIVYGINKNTVNDFIAERKTAAHLNDMLFELQVDYKKDLSREDYLAKISNQLAAFIQTDTFSNSFFTKAKTIEFRTTGHILWTETQHKL